jgi:putative ABC transport system permease protein
MLTRLIFGHAIHRPMRTVVTIAAVAIEVMLVLVIVGLTGGMVEEVGKRMEGVGADIMLQPPNASRLLAFSGAPMTIKIGEKIQTLKYVQSVAPVLLQFNLSGVDMIWGIDPASFHAVSGGFVFVSGHDMEGPDDMLVDDISAASKHIIAGQTYHVLEHDFHVTGIVQHGKGARVFVQLPTLQDLTGARDKASLFMIKCTRPEHTQAVIADIRSYFSNYQITPLQDYLSLMTSTALPGMDAFVNSMIGLAVCIGFLVIFLSMYTTVVERTREIGVLKSLGASQGYIVKALLSETTIISVAGIFAGIALSYFVRGVMSQKFPTMPIHLTADWMLRAAAIAIVSGLIGAAYPALMATRKDPVEALFFE